MGYFRIFYYVVYIFNTLTRIIKRHGKWLLWFVCIAIFLVVCMYNPKSQAAYLGDDSYYDPYFAITRQYDSICMDFIRRFDNYRNQVGVADTVQNVINHFKNFDYYIYYNATGPDDYGLSSINGGPFDDSNIRIVFYYNNNTNLSISPSLYDNYYNINDNIREVTYTTSTAEMRYYLNYLSSGSFSNVNANTKYYIPASLFHYNDSYIYEYFINNTSLKEIELMFEMRNKLTSLDDTLQQQQEYLEQEPSSEDFSTSDLPIDSGVTDTTTTGVDNIFTTVYNVFTGNVEVSKRNINVSIPFTRKKVSNSLYINK